MLTQRAWRERGSRIAEIGPTPGARRRLALPPESWRRSNNYDGAGEGNRTLVISLEGFCSTIELHPRTLLGAPAK